MSDTDINIVTREVYSCAGNCLSVYTKEYGFDAIAEASMINDNDYWYFNRIVVKDKLRNNGIASKLLDKLLEFIKERKTILICEVSPYSGTESDKIMLTDWYIRHGFEVKDKNTLIYKGDK